MKNTLSLTEVIFKGTITKVNFDFLETFLAKSNGVRFDVPEIENKDYEFIIDFIKSNQYADIAFDAFKLSFVSNIFVNLFSEEGRIELLFFLDLKDIDCSDHQKSIDMLITWAKDFELIHNFDEIICQPDNAEEDEFYFKNGKYGPMYNELA